MGTVCGWTNLISEMYRNRNSVIRLRYYGLLQIVLRPQSVNFLALKTHVPTVTCLHIGGQIGLSTVGFLSGRIASFKILPST